MIIYTAPLGRQSSTVNLGGNIEDSPKPVKNCIDPTLGYIQEYKPEYQVVSALSSSLQCYSQ